MNLAEELRQIAVNASDPVVDALYDALIKRAKVGASKKKFTAEISLKDIQSLWGTELVKQTEVILKERLSEDGFEVTVTYQKGHQLDLIDPVIKISWR